MTKHDWSRVDAVTDAEQQAIEENHIIRLSFEDQSWFVDLLVNPPSLTPAMERAQKAHERLALDRCHERTND